MRGYKIFSGTANPEFAKKISKYLSLPLSECAIKTFSDGEISVQIGESVRGKDVFVIQPTCAPANSNLMELLILTDALKRSSASSITAVVPYFGYARQDRKAAPRVPISAKLVANMMQTAGIDRVVTMDLHAGQIQGFFDVPVDNLYGSIVLIDYLKSKNLKNPIIASPDVGGVARARSFAKKLSLDLVIVDKRREEANKSEVMNVIGDVAGKDVILIDDMIDTAGTIVKAAGAFKQRGVLHPCRTERPRVRTHQRGAVGSARGDRHDPAKAGVRPHQSNQRRAAFRRGHQARISRRERK